jgi:phage N-6-adenine-methyltransferase
MEDWEAGLEAAKWMAKEQKDFVAWWDKYVRVRQSSGGKRSRADLRSIISMEKAEADTGIKHQQKARWSRQLGRPGYIQRIFKPSHDAAMADGAQRRADLQTGQMEWFTPARYVEKARSVLDGIDLDPASCSEAQETIKAGQFYSMKEDGLAQTWHGNVWLNPPYAGSLVAAFAAKMIASWQSKQIQAAIMLTNSYTETSWFHALASTSNAVCFTRGRIKFESPHGEKCAPTNGQCFFYFGFDLAKFAAEFADVGLVMICVEQVDAE